MHDAIALLNGRVEREAKRAGRRWGKTYLRFIFRVGAFIHSIGKSRDAVANKKARNFRYSYIYLGITFLVDLAFPYA